MKHYGLFIDGQWIDTEEKREVTDKYTGLPFATIAQASRDHVEMAVLAAREAFARRVLSPYERYEMLSRIGESLLENADRFCETLSREVGKPIKESRTEVLRAARTFEISAEEAKRIHGQMVPVESWPGSEGRLAFTVRVPVGVVCAITPFNFPLNLVAHKIAPAIAAGNTVVLKPTQETPVAAALLVELAVGAGMPRGHLNLLLGAGAAVGEWLLQNEGIDFYTFTGSTAVGERIRNSIGLRRCALELGNNSAVIVHRDADVRAAARLCAEKGFANAGQACTSVQRVYVHRDVSSEFVETMKRHAESLVMGNPLDQRTDIGPMISEKEVQRIDGWVQEAVRDGAHLVTGGSTKGTRFYLPTVLTNVNDRMKVVCEEAFAPLVVVMEYEDVDDAIRSVNSTTFGLQAGIFTRDMELAMKAARKIEAGGIIVNDTSSYRTEMMPYGGMKRSGVGKEGPKYAIEDMTQEKLVVLNLGDSR